MKKLQKGFTLIELLVVIAIIGILSSIVLASLSSARTKGEDSAITATLSNMRAQAELYYSSANSYGTSTANFAVCPVTSALSATSNLFEFNGTGGLFNLSKGLADKAGAANTRCAVYAASGLGSAWIAMAQLKSDSTKYYCADSAGNSIVKTATMPAATGVVVSATNVLCQ